MKKLRTGGRRENRMKRILTTALALTILAGLSGCGCDKKSESGSHIVDRIGVVSTTVPADATEPEETAEPKTISEPEADEAEAKVATVEADEVPTAQSTEEFKETEADDGYSRYVGGDTTWGMILPPEVQIGDESEEGSLFIVGDNIVTAVLLDRVIEITSIEAAKEYYEHLGDITIDDFTVIRDGGEYTGCFFEYITELGTRGFAKYVVSGEKTVSAAAENKSSDKAQDEVLREMVNSVVIFE